MTWDPASQATLAQAIVSTSRSLSALAARAVTVAGARPDERLALVERYLTRLADEEAPLARRAILEDVAHVFEQGLGDADRALTAWIAAFREAPSRDAWWTLERLAAETGRIAEVVAELEQALPQLAEAQRAEAWLRIGILREERLGHVDEALLGYAAALALGPTLRDAHARRLALLRRVDRVEDLLGALIAQADLERPAAAARCHVERAALLQRQGDDAAAAEAYRAALAADPAHDEARAGLELHLRGQRDEAGLAAFLAERLATADAGSRAPLRRELATLVERLGDRAAAITAWEAQRAAAPEDLDALRALERLYDAEGRDHDLVDVLAARVQLVADLGERGAIYRRLATLWSERLGQRDKAEECLEWLIAAGGDDDETFGTLAALYRADGKVRAAIDVMTRHAAATTAPAVRVALYGEVAELYEREIGDDQRAIDLWEKAEPLAADPGPARRALARLYARSETCDTERATLVLERAVACDVAEPAARLALARLHRLGGHQGRAAELLADVLAGSCDTGERVRVLVELAGLHDENDERERAITHYLEALALEPGHAEACERAADLLWREGRHAELWPLCERLAAAATHPRVRRSWLTRLAHAASASDVAVAAAAPALAELALDVDAPVAERAAIAAQLGLCALRAGRPDEARARLAHAETLVPGLRAVRLAEVELAGHAPPAVARLIGVELLATDHKHLHRLLDACEAERAWAPALDVLGLLIGLEHTAATRARYHLAAAAICAEELARPDDALAHHLAALADDPGLERAAAAAETALGARGDHATLLSFYMRRLGQLGPEADDGRRGERVRIWSAVADLCLGPLDERPSGLTALEVAVELDGTTARRARLADLYVELGADGRDAAIAEHQAILRGERDRRASYQALATLYADTGRTERARACTRALAVLDGSAVAAPEAVPAATGAPGILDAEAWALLRHPDADRLLDALFAAVTPALAAAQARGRSPVPFRRGTIPPGDARPCMRALVRVAASFGLVAPAAYPRVDLAAPVTFRLRVAGDILVPELLLGASLHGLDREDDAAATLALALAHLRPERVARIIADDRAGLCRVVDAAVVLATGGPAAAAVAATLALLTATLSPLALDQVATVGHRLHARAVASDVAVARWLDAGDRTAARAALAVADVTTVARRLEAEGASRERLIDLAWSSVTDELADVQARLAGAPPAARAASQPGASGRSVRLRSA